MGLYFSFYQTIFSNFFFCYNGLLNKNRHNNLKSNIVWGCFISTLGIGCSLWLLIYLEKISGTEFVALSLGFSIIGLIIAFSAEVQEFSIAGNGVKLKELRSEAEKTIEELKQARTETFRFLLVIIKRDTGFFDTNPFKDERINEFWSLYCQIEKFKDQQCLKEEIVKLIDALLSKQYRLLSSQNSNIPFSEYKNNMSPNDLLIKGLTIKEDEDSSKKQYLESQEFKQKLIEGVDEYKKLFDLKHSLLSVNDNA